MDLTRRTLHRHEYREALEIVGNAARVLPTDPEYPDLKILLDPQGGNLDWRMVAMYEGLVTGPERLTGPEALARLAQWGAEDAVDAQDAPQRVVDDHPGV